jgi:hypothetical protein
VPNRRDSRQVLKWLGWIADEFNVTIRRIMPDRPVALRVPEQCPHCGVFAKVKLETTVKAEAVLLAWCCTACSRSWPVRGQDEMRLPNAS